MFTINDVLRHFKSAVPTRSRDVVEQSDRLEVIAAAFGADGTCPNWITDHLETPVEDAL